MKNLFKVALVVLATAMCMNAAMAAKAKKEKVTDPRLLAVMKMSKTVKETQFIKKGDAASTNHRAVMGFDVTADEATVYYSQPGTMSNANKPGVGKPHENYIVRKQEGSKDKQTLRYFGSGQGMCLESTPEGDYIWIGSLGDKWHGHYGRTRAVSRFKYEAGAELNDGFAGETYYMGGGTNRYCLPAVNVQDNILCISTSNAGAITFNIYNLDEARAMGEEEVKVKTHWKGEALGEEEELVTRTVKVRDMRTLDPKASFTVAKPEKENVNEAKDINSLSFRAFDVDKDFVYFVEGKNNKGKYADNGESKAFITVFDHNGNVVLERRRISVIGDKMFLENIGAAVEDYADAYGIKVRDNKVYFMFTGRKLVKGKNALRANIVKYE